MTYPYQSEPPPPPDPTPAYYPPIYPYGYQAPPPTEGLAIASLVISCAAVLGLCAYGIGGFLGIIGALMGHSARRRIRINGSNGAGMALAGIIVGWIMTAISLLAITGLIIAVVLSQPS
jgi:hypothetical protein